MKRCAFSFDFKISKDDDFLMSKGNSFHSLGAAQVNTQSPSIIFVLCDGVCSKLLSILGTAQVASVLERFELYKFYDISRGLTNSCFIRINRILNDIL